MAVKIGGTNSLLKREMSKLKPGDIISVRDYLNLGSRNSIDQFFYRWVRKKKLIRLAWGIFTLPKTILDKEIFYKVIVKKIESFNRKIFVHNFDALEEFFARGTSSPEFKMAAGVLPMLSRRGAKYGALELQSDSAVLAGTAESEMIANAFAKLLAEASSPEWDPSEWVTEAPAEAVIDTDYSLSQSRGANEQTFDLKGAESSDSLVIASSADATKQTGLDSPTCVNLCEVTDGAMSIAETDDSEISSQREPVERKATKLVEKSATKENAAAELICRYATDGNSTRFRALNVIVELRSNCARKVKFGDSRVGLLIRGVWATAKELCNSELYSRIKNCLRRKEQRTLERNCEDMPAWMSDWLVHGLESPSERLEEYKERPKNRDLS